MNSFCRYEFTNSNEPYASTRFAESTQENMVWSFNYYTMMYDKLLSKSDYLACKMETSQLHKERIKPNIYNVQVSTRNKKTILIYNCYFYAVTENEVIKTIKHNFKHISNMAFRDTYQLKEFIINFDVKGKTENTSFLAKDKAQAKRNFKKQNKNSISSKTITNIVIL